MSAIDDNRPLAHAFVTPDIQDLTVRVEALEKSFADNEKQAENPQGVLERSIAAIEQRAEKRHAEVMFYIRMLLAFHSLSQRVAALEAAHNRAS